MANVDTVDYMQQKLFKQFFDKYRENEENMKEQQDQLDADAFELVLKEIRYDEDVFAVMLSSPQAPSPKFAVHELSRRNTGKVKCLLDQ